MFLLIVSCTLVAENLGAPKDSGDSSEVVFEVPQGAMASTLGGPLAEAGLVASADNFALYVKMTKEGGCLKAGRFRLKPSMTAGELLETLCGVPIPDEVPFTVVEGWRIREIDDALAEAGLAADGAYEALAHDVGRFSAPFALPTDHLEGYLLPETYMVSPDGFEVEAFIQRQMDLLAERFYTPHQAPIEAGRGMADLVVMASMLEREEPRAENRNLVAGILWKRLDSQWNLGVDATSRYTLEEWNDRKAFLKKLRDPDDPYNTRLRGGLPPTPIGNPSVTSLVAALTPEQSEFWYYLHDAEKNLHPSRNVKEHEAYRRKYDVY